MFCSPIRFALALLPSRFKVGKALVKLLDLGRCCGYSLYSLGVLLLSLYAARVGDLQLSQFLERPVNRLLEFGPSVLVRFELLFGFLGLLPSRLRVLAG